MGALALTVIVVAGLVFGFGVQYFTHPRTRIDWLFVAIATGVGAYLGGEVLTSAFATMAGGPEFDGLFIVPAAITGLVLGMVTDAVVRYVETEPA